MMALVVRFARHDTLQVTAEQAPTRFRHIWWVIALAAAFAGTFGMAPLASAQTADEKVDQLIQLLGDTDVQALLKARATDPDPAAPAAAGDDLMTTWLTTINAHVSAVLGAVDDVPAELEGAASTLAERLSGSKFLLFALFTALVFGAGFGADRVTRNAMQVRSAGPDAGIPAVGAGLADGLLGRVLPILAFLIAAGLVYLAVPWPIGSAKLVLAWVVAIFVIRLMRAATDFAAAVQSDPAQVETYRYWGHRVSRFTVVLFVGWAVVKDLLALNVDGDVALLVAYAFGLGLIALAMEMVWNRKLAVGASLTQFRAMNLFLSFWFVLLGVLWVAGTTLLLWIGIYAILFPVVLPLITQFVRSIFGIPENWEKPTDAAQPAPKDAIRMVLIERGARIAVIGAAIAWVASLIVANPSAMMQDQTVQRLAAGIAQGVLILLVADLIWQVTKAAISSKLMDLSATTTDPAEAARAGRLRTLLPILRNVLATLIGTVAVMMVLSGLGVAIGPLIAGAGIFGVAIGFGSQTLVKDVISGVFYMLDDAFRVGEYIQSGSYKGVVESFSLRSVRLRHHRGPVYTIPFGTLGAVQNMSRDWAKDKFMISVPFDTDLELVRKLSKKVGQTLLEDPEFGPSFLEPLKLKGVEQFGEYGITLGFGMMVKPGGQQVMIRRRAYVMINKAFAENGIKFASPTVQVAGDEQGAAAAALATKHAMDRKVAAEQAAAAGI